MSEDVSSAQQAMAALSLGNDQNKGGGWSYSQPGNKARRDPRARLAAAHHDTESNMSTAAATEASQQSITADEASELVNRLSARRGCRRKHCTSCEVCKAGGATSHVKSFEPRRVRSSYSRSRSRSNSMRRN